MIDERTEEGGAGVAIAVRDSGAGIPPEVFTHLFEPFYTTKGAGNGLGLGLTISASIAEALGGHLRAANAPGGGAVFTLWLPCAAEAQAEHAS
jgi:two-component system C4-dicarboxylate transport sensor histidine kinase DctB